MAPATPSFGKSQNVDYGLAISTTYKKLPYRILTKPENGTIG